ncbi:SpoVR family protein [Candidatus Parcubacteria bacterium]|nr:MAG: SpoVR family protein [Candidatus Parcubacteria bacterium]
MEDIFQKRTLPADLVKLSDEIFSLTKEYGLTHFPIKFVLVSPKELNGIAAYTGFPVRLNHWTYGMEYEDLHKRYQYGVSKIYELVINTNPVIAYLLNTNTLVDQKLVMVHVCGHADFFYNNQWFAKTNRQMIDQMANNASRVARISQKWGEQVVEDFINVCLSIGNLIDPYQDHIKRNYPKSEEDDAPNHGIPKLKANDYLDPYINTKEFMDQQKRRLEVERQQRKKFPERPDRDILGFLVEHTPLEQWQKDILAMVREEEYYFAPQRMTKIMNEGWATYIHSKFMTGHLADDSDIIDYCDSQSRAIAAGDKLNPYRLGLALFKDIEERWNKGKFGPEWDRCQDMEEKKNWDKKLGLGKDKILQIRKTHNDLTFIDDFLTPEFCIEQELFAFHRAPNSNYDVVSNDFSKIKNRLLQMLANGGSPVIQIADANYENRGELYLLHEFAERELDMTKAKDTLENLFKVWTRPIHLQTIETDDDGNKTQDILMSYNGKEHQQAKL